VSPFIRSKRKVAALFKAAAAVPASSECERQPEPEPVA